MLNDRITKKKNINQNDIIELFRLVCEVTDLAPALKIGRWILNIIGSNVILFLYMEKEEDINLFKKKTKIFVIVQIK